MALAGALEIQLYADMARLRDDMNKATGLVERSSKQIESAAGVATKALGALGIGLSVVGFAHLIKGSVDAMDKLNDLSKSTNLSVETLAGLNVAAKQSGGDLDSIAASVNKLSVEMGKAPEKFRALGISATDKLEAFKQLADILNAIEDPQQRAAVAAAALGKSWAGAAPLLAEGSAKIGEMVEQGTRAAGVTTEMAKQADALNDKWVLLVGSGGLLNSLVGPMLPLLNMLAEDMLKASDGSKNLGTSFSPLLEILKTLLVVGSDVSFVFQTIGKEMAGLAAGAAMIAKGDFAGARALGDVLRKDGEDTRKALDAYQKAIMGMGGAGPGAGGGRGASSGALGGGTGTSAAANDFLGVGAAERAAAAKAAAKVIADAQKAELASYTEVAKLTKALREQEIADGYHLEKLHEKWSQEEQKQADDKLAASVSAVDAIRVSLLTEQELMAEHYNAQLEALVAARELKAITDAQYNEYAVALEQQHMDQLTEVRKKGLTDLEKFTALSYRGQAKTVFGELASLTAGVAQNNRTMFELNKASGIAMAVINAYEGISLTMAKYPFPLNVAMAAAHGVAAFAQVQAIRSASFGGGAAPSIAGSTPATPVTPVTSGSPGVLGGNGQTTIVQLQGDTFGRKQVKALIEQLNENTKDGGRIVLA